MTDLQCSGGLSAPRSLHVLPVFTRVSSTKNPNRKTCKRTEKIAPCPSLTKIGLNTWPGPRAPKKRLPTAPGCLEEGQGLQDGLKAIFTGDLISMCVCVCVRTHVCECMSMSVCVCVRAHMCECVCGCVCVGVRCKAAAQPSDICSPASPEWTGVCVSSVQTRSGSCCSRPHTHTHTHPHTHTHTT